MEYKLQEVFDIHNSKRIPLSKMERNKQANKLFPYYGAQGIIDYVEDFLFDGEYLLVAEDGENLKTRNENIAQVANGKFWVNNHAHILSVKENFNTYYLLNKLNYMDISGYLTGTVQPKLSRRNLEQIRLNLPDKNTQDKIGNFILKLSNKLQVNQKIIANLEELSQTLFKRWFVDFEFPDENGNPYKSSGGEMIDSELGEIPEGWKIGHFSHFCKKPIAGDWGKEQKQGNYVKPVRVIRGADINDYSKGGKGKSPIRFILQKNFDNKKLISGDIIVEISGGSPTQSTGRTLLINNKVLKNSEYELVCTNFCKVIRPLDEKIGEWLAYYFNYLYFRDVFFNYENGTTGIKNLDYKSIMNTMKIIAPSTQILNNFHNLISKYKINIQYLGMENDYLTQLRDTLLPKLMSGEIEIPDDIEVNEDELSI